MITLSKKIFWCFQCGFLLFGLAIGAFGVYFTHPNAALKTLEPLSGLAGTNADFLSKNKGVAIGPFAIYHTSEPRENLALAVAKSGYPIIYISEKGPGLVAISVSDRQQNIWECFSRDGKFEVLSYFNIRPNALQVSNIDLDADGAPDLIAKKAGDVTDQKFLINGQWYPYKVEGKKRMAQAPDGWREIVRTPSGFQFR